MKKKLIEYIEVNGKRRARALVEFRVFVGNASFLVRKGMISGELGENTILVKSWSTSDTMIYKDCQIRNSFITDNATIEQGCHIHHSTIKGCAVIGVNSHIARSLVKDYAKVSISCFIDCSTLEDHCTVQSGVHLHSVKVLNYTDIPQNYTLYRATLPYTGSYFNLPFVGGKFINLKLKYTSDYIQTSNLILVLLAGSKKRKWSQIIKDYNLTAEDQYFITKQFKLHFGDDPKLEILLNQ